MHLYLVRHADALSQTEAGVVSDGERPLSPKGREFLAKALPLLKKSIPSLDSCLTSPYVRALETAENLVTAIPCQKPLEKFEGLKPDSPPKILLAELDRRKTENHIMLVGHEPYLGSLFSYLLSGRFGSSIPFAKGGMAHIEVYAIPPHGLLPDLRWFYNPPIVD